MVRLSGLVVLGQVAVRSAGTPRPAATSRRSPLLGLEQARDELTATLSGSDVPNGVEVKRIALGVHLRRTPDPDATFALPRGSTHWPTSTASWSSRDAWCSSCARPASTRAGRLPASSTSGPPGVVLYAGDDLGDLAAFAAVRALRDEGVSGVTVCAVRTRPRRCPRVPTSVVDGPQGVVALLAVLADIITKD